MKNLIGRVWKNNHAVRAARSYEQVRRPSSENYHIYRFDEYLSIQPLGFSFVYLLWQRSD